MDRAEHPQPSHTAVAEPKRTPSKPQALVSHSELCDHLSQWNRNYSNYRGECSGAASAMGGAQCLQS